MCIILKEGLTVTRNVGGLKMPLKITKLDDYIHCGDWKFSRVTGSEIDEELGWNEIISGSYLEEVYKDYQTHKEIYILRKHLGR